jgi:hypothetical protein
MRLWRLIPLLVGAIAFAPGAAVAGESGSPPFVGLMSFPAIEDVAGPDEFSWEVTLAEGQELEYVDSLHARVYYTEDNTTAFVIDAERAHGADGAEVPTSLEVRPGNVITLLVHHRAGNPAAGGAPFDYPIEAGGGWELGSGPVQIFGPPDEAELKKRATPVQDAASEPAASDPVPLTLVCKPVVNPYAGTRYEGVNLSKITATGIACGVARRVAREAHGKALEMPLPASGILQLTWHRWNVTGNLRPASDVYVAKLGAMRVHWRF